MVIPKICYLFMVCFILCGTSVMASDTLYVSKTGSNEYPYDTWEKASAKIQEAINAADTGNVIMIGRGTYIEKMTVTKPLSFYGLERNSCIIDITEISDYDSFDFMFELEAPAEFYNMTMIVNSDPFGKKDYCIYSIGYRIEAENCKLLKGSIASIDSYVKLNNIESRGAHYAVNTSVVVNPDIVVEITNSKIYARNTCINTSGGNYIIRNNILSGDSLSAFAVYHSMHYDSMIFENNIVTNINIVGIRDHRNWYESRVRNNLFYNCTSENGLNEVYNVSYAPGKIFQNNILYNCSRAYYQGGADTLEVDYNLYWKVPEKKSGAIKLGEHEIDAWPMFADMQYDPVEGDFRLQAHSPGIDQGNPEILDVDGTRSDIGPTGGPGGISYEYEDLPPRPVEFEEIKYDSLKRKVTIEWRGNKESDISGYRIYGDTSSTFIPGEENLIEDQSDTVYIKVLPVDTGSRYYYLRVQPYDTEGNESGSDSMVVVETGDTTITGVREAESNYSYGIHGNYPNPFNPETRVVYELKEESRVEKEIYDIKGELILRESEKEERAGIHEYRFNGSDLPSGVYIIRITARSREGKERYRAEHKLMLLK